MIERWQHGPVDLAAEHFELSYSGKGETKTEAAAVVAAIGPPAGGLLNVSILIDRNRTNAGMIVAVEREIDFYFLELNEPDPWVYAQYHCGTGTGSELRRPLGIAIVGGLIVSQVLTLYTTPVVYLFFDRQGRRHGTRSTTPETHALVAGD